MRPGSRDRTPPDEKWLTDISEFQILAEKVYSSPMIDCFDGMVVSWSIGTNPDVKLVKTMLDAAIETVAESTEKPIVHSDRGGHYRSPGWLSRVAKASLIGSISRKACSPDNAAYEGLFGRLKTEMFYPRVWRSTTIAQFIEELDATFAGTTKSGSRTPLVISVPSNTVKSWA